jgi:hypothetical protein
MIHFVAAMTHFVAAVIQFMFAVIQFMFAREAATAAASDTNGRIRRCLTPAGRITVSDTSGVDSGV